MVSYVMCISGGWRLLGTCVTSRFAEVVKPHKIEFSVVLQIQVVYVIMAKIKGLSMEMRGYDCGYGQLCWISGVIDGSFIAPYTWNLCYFEGQRCCEDI